MSEPTRGRWKVASPATIPRIALVVQSVSNRVAQRTDQGLGKTLQGNRRMFTTSWLPACAALDWSSTEPEAPQLREVRQEGHAVIPDLSRHPDQLQPVCTSLSRFSAPRAAAWPRSRSTVIPLPPFVLWSKPRRPVLQSSRTGPRPCARRSCTCKASAVQPMARSPGQLSPADLLGIAVATLSFLLVVSAWILSPPTRSAIQGPRPLPWSDLSKINIASRGSKVSIASIGSLASIGSVGSVLSIGTASQSWVVPATCESCEELKF